MLTLQQLVREGRIESRKDKAELLLHAVDNDDVDVVRALLEVGADPNTTYFETGADPATPGFDDRSALDCARQRRERLRSGPTPPDPVGRRLFDVDFDGVIAILEQALKK
jgi:hypothetical protein